METGEKELRKAFEETSTRNINAAIAHGNETRKLTRTLEDRVKLLEEKEIQNKNTIEELRKQIQTLQIKLYTGGI